MPEKAGDQHRPPHPNLLPQAIGRKTPDKRNRSPSAMARPASRKAVSSLPAIANIDEQLGEVVMSDMQHVISIIAHVAQALATVAFLFLMWKWSRPQRKSEIQKEQSDAAERCMNLINQLEKKHLEEDLNCRYYK